MGLKLKQAWRGVWCQRSLWWVEEHTEHFLFKKELLFAFMPPILNPEILQSCEILLKSQKQSTEYVRSEFDFEGLRNDNTMAP